MRTVIGVTNDIHSKNSRSKLTEHPINTVWREKLRDRDNPERYQVIGLLARQYISNVKPLLLTYQLDQDENIREGIIRVLSYVASGAVPILIQQLTEGPPMMQECARIALSQIESSQQPLLHLIKTKPQFTEIVKQILNELSIYEGVPLSPTLVDEQKVPKELSPNNTVNREHRIQRAIEVLAEAKLCFDIELYSRTVKACDDAVQQLLTFLLDALNINLGNKSNKMPAIRAQLRKYQILQRVDTDLEWLRKFRNNIRYYQGKGTRQNAMHALHIGQAVSREVKRVLKM